MFKKVSILAIFIIIILLIIILWFVVNISNSKNNDTFGFTIDGVDSAYEQRSAFGELLVAQPTQKIEVQFPYNINPREVATSTGGNGRVYWGDNMANLSTSANTNSSSTLETRSVLKYLTGEGGLVRFTAIFTNCTVGSTQEIGIGDSVDGFFFGCNEAGNFGIIRRASSTSYFTAQTEWSDDTMNGNGVSGINLDITKGNVYQIRYQWLGFGQISFFVENQNTGFLTVVHRIKYANENTATSINNPTLPIRLSVQNTTNSTDIILKSASLAAFVEGKNEFGGFHNSTSANKSNITTEQAVLTIRSTSTFSNITNRIRAKLDIVSAASEGTKVVDIRILRNTTLGGTPVFNDIDTTTSIMQVDEAGTTVSGGSEILSFQLGRTDSEVLFIDPLNIYINPNDTITITASSSVATDVVASFTWSEEF